MLNRVFTKRDLQKSYDAIYSKGVLKEADPYYDWILKLLRVREGKRLLDVACGGGFLLKAAEKRGLITYGIDISPAALSIAKKYATRSRIFIGDAENLPWKNNFFDYVTCLGSLEHFLHPDKGVREIARVLKKSGKACLVLPNIYFIRYIWDILKGGAGPQRGQALERLATMEEWKNPIESNGLDIIEIHKYNPKGKIESLENLVYTALRPLIPLNLSYSFVFIVQAIQ